MTNASHTSSACLKIALPDSNFLVRSTGNLKDENIFRRETQSSERFFGLPKVTQQIAEARSKQRSGLISQSQMLTIRGGEMGGGPMELSVLQSLSSSSLASLASLLPFSPFPAPRPPASPGASAQGGGFLCCLSSPVISAQAEIYGSHFKDFSLIITFVIILEIKS